MSTAMMTYKEQFATEGFCVARGLFSAEEIEFYRAHFEKLRVDGFPPETYMNLDPNDPLKMYPRLMQPHRQDQVSFDWLTDPRLNEIMTDITGFEPFAVQTMFYFKPAGARGQALHQDNFYLKASPSTCIAAWMAVDDCDEENGCLMVVPGSQDIPVLCLVPADPSKSFTDVQVEVPEGMEVRPITMKAGDVLFFNGQIIHGSNPNTTKDRFRRSLIGHYVIGNCDKVSQYYHPVFRMDKTQVEFGINEGGGKCGEWIKTDGGYEVVTREATGRDTELLTE